MNEARHHGSLLGLVWDGFAGSLPLSMLACLILSFVAVVCGDLSVARTAPYRWESLGGFLAVLPLVSTTLLAASGGRARWRLWPLGASLVVGVATGLGFLFAAWHKARNTGPFTVSPWVWVEVAALAAGWAIAFFITRWRSKPKARGERPANLCPACGYDLFGLPLNATCPECGERYPAGRYAK